MIERSHRHKKDKAQPKPETLLRLHERLASQRLWFFRFVMASGLTLVVSFVLWLARVPLTWHLVGLAVSFGAGLFIHRPMKAWAISWIRERVGLSYETALEHGEQDTFGFADTLRQRASEEASRLTPPKYQAWWLPLLAVALGLAFLPLIPSLPTLPTALSPQPTPTTTPTTSNQTPNTVEPSLQTQAQAAAEPPSASPSSARAEGETEASQLDEVTGSSGAAPSQNNQSADEEALGRFLENLRENEQPQDQAPDVDLSSVMQPSSRSGQASDEDRASRPRSEQKNPFAQAGQPEEPTEGQSADETNQGSEESQGQQQSEQNQSQESQAQENQAQEQAQQEQAQNQDDAGGEGSAEALAEQNQGQGEGTQQGEQGQEGGGERGTNAEGMGSQQDSNSGQNAEGAGSLPGTPTAQSTEVTGTSQQNPDFLPGQLSGGPNNIAGTVRLPGEAGQTVFPEGSAPGSFSRAEEEALSEGRIPLEYQEVIRNYFRQD